MEISKAKRKRVMTVTALCLVLLSLIQFLLYYVPFGFFYDSAPTLLAASYLIDFIEAFFPIISAMIIFLTRENGIKNKLLPSFIFSLTRLLYSVPYYYVYFVSDVFDSGEAIALAFLISILFVFVSFLQIFVCNIVINYIENRQGKSTNDRQSSKLFNLDDHLNFGIAMSVFFVFIIFFVRECVSTVQYLIDNAPGYRPEEIVTIVCSFLLLFVFALTQYVIAVAVKNKFLKK